MRAVFDKAQVITMGEEAYLCIAIPYREAQKFCGEMKPRKYVAEIKEYREKRSLDANALLWVCIGEIAAVLRADKWDIYLLMLKRYGKFTHICVKPEAVEDTKAQWRESEVIGELYINGKKAVQMLCYFGSSTYNSREFSVLLDGVISEMQHIGLTPPTPRELRSAIAEIERREAEDAQAY